MLKFKFNYLNQTLAYQKPCSELWSQIDEPFTGNFGSLGFPLPEGWISFTVYSNRIRVFYKQLQSGAETDFWEPQSITYFRKDLPKQGPVIFEFASADQVEKVAGRWVKKGEPKM
jgi:hypothetical protein